MMLHLEIAVAPSEIITIEQLSLLGARLGFEKGAVLSGFPKRWYAEVAHKLNSANEIAEKKIIERLQAFKDNKIVSFARNYEGDSWAAAARISHQQLPFHRLVDESFNESPVYLGSLAELDDVDFLYTATYRRDAASLAGAAEALLIGAERVTIYDPYICISKPGYQNTLLKMMLLCRKAEVEFHIFSEEAGKRDWVERENYLSQFKAELPTNIKLYWYCVDDHGSGFLHPRGLFTAKGGLIYDRGFEEPNDRSQRDEYTDIMPMPIQTLQAKSQSYNTALQYENFDLVRSVWCSNS